MRGRRLVRFLRRESGQGAVEYAIILGVTAIGAGFALLLLRDSMGGTLQGARERIEAAAIRGQSSSSEAGGADEAGDVGDGGPTPTYPTEPGNPGSPSKHHGNGKGNSGGGRGNSGPNGRKD